MTSQNQPLDLDGVRAKLGASRGKDYWRSLEELSQTEGFRELLQREYPRQTGEWTDAVSRRQFLMLMGASLALAGLTGCSQAPRERIMPYVRAPEEIVPGRPLFFATAMPLAGYATGLLVENHMGRPTKVEGNPSHPACPLPPDSPPQAKYGPTDVFAQASILTLYDPERSQTVTHLGDVATWEAFAAAYRTAMGNFNGERGVRLRLLTETVTSPSLAQQIRTLLARFPRAKWHQYEPAGGDNARLGAHFSFGEYVETYYRFDRADVILSLDADFLSWGPAKLRYARDFIARRKVRLNQSNPHMNRLYVIESMPTITGAKADHRLPLRSSQIESLARALGGQLGIQDRRADELGVWHLGDIPPHDVSPEWIRAVADDLRSHRGTSIVLAGEVQPPYVHALAQQMNRVLGNTAPDRTVVHTAPVEAEPVQQIASLQELVRDMLRGQVDMLLILGGNPVYTAPVDLNFADGLARVPFRAHLSLYEDETSAACHWHLPEAHFLESWGDARAYDGTVSIIQPLISPLYEGKSAHELLAVFNGQPELSGHGIIRRYWHSLFDPADRSNRTVHDYWQRQGLLQAFRGNFETWWQTALHEGLIAQTSLPAKAVTWRSDWSGAPGVRPRQGEPGLEIAFRPDPTIFDGRFANNGWLQELPKPLSKLTWDNAAVISPATAVRLGFAAAGQPEQANEQMVELEYQGQRVQAPLMVLPGHADDAVTLHLGYGRTRSGRVGTGLGVSAYRLRSSSAPWFDTSLSEPRPLGRRHTLALTQHHHLMENRHLIWSGDFAQRAELAREIRQTRRQPLSLYSEHPYEGNKWGMVIDVGACIGCNACVIACQAENNIPVVGRDQVSRGREMHWLRIDTYYQGNPVRPANLETYFQPVPCMQCENAPCELVCPVDATVHSSDGLNDMVYNRCVGTRYCSNNCPYKVRRFNFLQYSDFATESLRLMRNPEVTVRSRGVMEKCTYCVQRIRRGQIDAQREDRPIGDGDIVTACQAACPAGAIVFGDLNDRNRQGPAASRVAQLQDEPLHYSLLEDLNTRPRTTYLGALRNPNPAITRIEARAR